MYLFCRNKFEQGSIEGEWLCQVNTGLRSSKSSSAMYRRIVSKTRLSWNCWNQVQATAAIICCKQMFSAESESVEWHPVHRVLVNKKEALTRLYLWQGGDLNTINFVNIFILVYLCCLTITKLKSQFYIGWNPSSFTPSPLMCLPSSGGVVDLFSNWWKTITEPGTVSPQRVF